MCDLQLSFGMIFKYFVSRSNALIVTLLLSSFVFKRFSKSGLIFFGIKIMLPVKTPNDMSSNVSLSVCHIGITPREEQLLHRI